MDTADTSESSMALHLDSGSFLGTVGATASLGGILLREIAHAPSTELPTHVHELPYFCFVLVGQLDERCGGAEERCGGGMGIFNPAWVEHSDRISSKGARCVVAELSMEWTTEHLEGVRLDAWRALLGPTASWAAANIRTELYALDSASALSIAGHILVVSAQMNRLANAADGCPGWVRRGAQRLRSEWLTPPSVAALATEAGVHPVHFARVFRSRFRCTPGEYVRRIRIEWARGQISTGDRSLSEIAHAAGFSDHAHFSRTFKRHTGVTPSAHRAASRR
jgi:AraC family transcriptional regulator